MINIEQQDLSTQPSEAYLLFEGRLTKADNTAYANADAIALTNNGLMYLFSQISYQLLNQDIETVFHPGQATTMIGLLNYTDDFSKAQGLNQLWQKDTTSTAVIADNTGFKARQACLIQKPTDFKDLYPLMVFDVSKKSERLKSSVVDVQIKAIFTTAVPANTEAFAVVISDKMLQFQSDGSKMSVVY